MSPTPSPPSSFLRLLVLSPPASILPDLLQGSESPSGLHLILTTPYYSAAIPIWHDTINFTALHTKTWEAEWRSLEAAEVVRSIGAWAVCFLKPTSKEEYDAILHFLHTISSLISHHQSSSYDDPPLHLAIALPQSRTPHLLCSAAAWQKFEDECQEAGDSGGAVGGGWEVIDAEAASRDTEGKERRNDYGEKVGMARVREALEAHEWNLKGGGEHKEEGGLLGLDDEDEGNDSKEGGDSSIGSSPLFGAEEGLGALQAPSLEAQHGTGTKTSLLAEQQDLFASLRTPLLPHHHHHHHHPPAAKSPISPETAHDEVVNPEEQQQQKQKNPTTSTPHHQKYRDNNNDDHQQQQEEEDEGSESQIGDLEQMMLRLQAVREMSADLPEVERKRAAKKAVEGVMRML